MDIAGNNGGHKSVETSKDGQIILPLLIEVPQIPIEELKEATDNFGPKLLIGEDSYGQVYYYTCYDFEFLDTEGSYGQVVLHPLSGLT